MRLSPSRGFCRDSFTEAIERAQALPMAGLSTRADTESALVHTEATETRHDVKTGPPWVGIGADWKRAPKPIADARNAPCNAPMRLRRDGRPFPMMDSRSIEAGNRPSNAIPPIAAMVTAPNTQTRVCGQICGLSVDALPRALSSERDNAPCRAPMRLLFRHASPRSTRRIRLPLLGLDATRARLADHGADSVDSTDCNRADGQNRP